MSYTQRLMMSLSLVGLLALVSAAADWPAFRGKDGSAITPEADLPVKWGKEEGLRYKVPLPGRGLSNPVIAAGRVYVTACSGYRHRRLHVLCFDETTGKKVWERQFEATGNTACHPTTNMAAPTPVTDGEAVYALFATGDLIALDRSGVLLWYRSLVGDYPDITNQVGMASSPTLAGDVLLVPMENAGDSFTAGIDKKTGVNLWRSKRTRETTWCSPVVVRQGDKTAVLFQTRSEATLVEPQTGKVLWKKAASELEADLSAIQSPAVGDGLVVLSAGELIALKPDLQGGEPKELWRGAPGGAGYASPVLHAGRVYRLSQVALLCFDAATGKELWRERITGPFDGSPVIAGNRLYAVNNKGRTTVIELGDKKGSVLARNDIDDTIQATPAIANGCIYLRSDKYLYCIGPKK